MPENEMVFLNGSFLPLGEAVVSVEDRGFNFGDAVYEATPLYSGCPFRLQDHLDRLARGLDFLRIDYDVQDLIPVHESLVSANNLGSAPFAVVYLQITRGVARRTHAFPRDQPTPTVYGFARELTLPTDERFSAGASAISLVDQRWRRPDIKTTNLLPNVLAQQAATEAGADDVVMHRDDVVTEGTHNNLFVVCNDRLVTPRADESILRGITRQVVLELAAEHEIEVEQRPLAISEVRDASELFFVGTTTELRATTVLDGNPVGSGQVGPVATTLRQAFVQLTRGSSASGGISERRA
ncbi:MAG: aminotransferase class IV [Actinomycetota bacterium]